MISLLAFSRYTPESLLHPLSCHLLSLFPFLSHSQESKCPCISFFHILLLHSIGIFVLLKHLHICCHMQMQNNKPELFILQTGAGGLPPLILTQYSSLLITGDGEEGNLNVGVLNPFDIGVLSLIFYFKHFTFQCANLRYHIPLYNLLHTKHKSLKRHRLLPGDKLYSLASKS